MKLRTSGMLCLLFGIACAEAALAMPKAAENEAAQVSRGADVARPKLSVKAVKLQAGGRHGAPATERRAGPAKPPRAAKAQHGNLAIQPLTLC